MSNTRLFDDVSGGLTHGAVWDRGTVIGKVEAFAALQSGDPYQYLKEDFDGCRVRAGQAGKDLLQHLVPGTEAYNRALTDLKVVSQALMTAEQELDNVKKFPTNFSFICKAKSAIGFAQGHLFNVELLVGNAKS